MASPPFKGYAKVCTDTRLLVNTAWQLRQLQRGLSCRRWRGLREAELVQGLMEHQEAVALLRDGLEKPGGTWADLGAGTGTFTRALAELLGPEGTVYAVDRDAGALAYQRHNALSGAAIVPRQGDFTRPLELQNLDGILMANALHFVRDQARVLARIVAYLRPGGRFLLVEYDQHRGNPWVPFPVALTAFRRLAGRVGLSEPQEVGRRRSAFGHREIYAAVAVRKGAAQLSRR